MKLWWKVAVEAGCNLGHKLEYWVVGVAKGQRMEFYLSKGTSRRKQVTRCLSFAGNWTLSSVTSHVTLQKERSTSKCLWMYLLLNSAVQRICIWGTFTLLFPHWLVLLLCVPALEKVYRFVQIFWMRLSITTLCFFYLIMNGIASSMALLAVIHSHVFLIFTSVCVSTQKVTSEASSVKLCPFLLQLDLPLLMSFLVSQAELSWCGSVWRPKVVLTASFHGMTSYLLWFYPGRQLSTTQLLAYSPQGGVGERIAKIKVQELIDWAKDSSVGRARAVHKSKENKEFFHCFQWQADIQLPPESEAYHR